MPDITMCPGKRNRDGKVCPLAMACYRYMAFPTPGRQSYFQTAPYETSPAVGFQCLYYWEYTDEKVKAEQSRSAV